MDPQRYQRIKRVFQSALESEGAERTRVLDSECGSDLELRVEVESMLAHYRDDFLEESPIVESRIGGTIGRFEIVRSIGQGGMGEVYLARDPELGRDVALKVLLPEFAGDTERIRQFRQEARAASALNHPNIVTIYEIGEDRGLTFIATEFVDGRGLDELIADGVGPETAADIAMQILSALAEAHQAGVIHQDIKPSNIVVSAKGVVKLLDFGLAKFTVAGKSDGGESGKLMGTLPYMSPERFRRQPADARSDIFSFGVVFLELLTGQSPFRRETTAETMAAVLNDSPDLSGVPAELRPIIAEALAKDPDLRTANAGHVAAKLRPFAREPLAESEGSSDALGTVPIRPATTRTIAVGWRVGWLIAVVGLFLAVGAAALYFGGAGRTPDTPFSAKRRLAVIPFTNLAPSAETDYLGFAFADTLNSKLTSMRTFKVYPSSLMSKYHDVEEFVRERKADYIVSGTYLKEAGKITVTSQVLDASKSETLFQDRFELTDLELSQSSEIIARRLINELRLRPNEIAKYSDMTHIDPVAYDHFLKGIEQYSRFRLTESIENLEKAVTMEPDFAVAWDKLGSSYLVFASTQFGGREFYARAERSFRKAIEIDPGFALPRLHLTNILTETNRKKESIEILLDLLKSDPENPMIWWELSYAYRFAGRLEKSIEAGEKAHQVDPGFFLNAAAPNYYLYVGDYEKFKQSLSPRSDSAYIRFYHGFAEFHLKNFDVAKAHFDEAFRLDSGSMQTQIGKALSHEIAGDRPAARELMLKIEKEIVDRDVSDGEGIYKAAQAFAVIGDTRRAVRLFRLSVDKGFICHPYFQKDPLIDGLRTDPQFQTVLVSAKRSHDEFDG